jgi:hypothetical protein
MRIAWLFEEAEVFQNLIRLTATSYCPSRYLHMGHEEELQVADQAVQAAHSLIRAQEADIGRMREAGLNTQRAEALLHAYRDGARLTEERKQALVCSHQSRWKR